MPNTPQTYLDLITSEHQNQPNFSAMILQIAAAFVQMQNLAISMEEEGGIFDLSTPPVGDQLDIIGQWVGISRYLAIPIEGVYFSWDDTSQDGWDFGAWFDPVNPGTNITVLSDPFYLTLILAKIAANSWDGTTEGAYAIWNIVFPGLVILIQDNENMSFDIAIQGTILDSVTQALLTQGLIPLKPEGVRINSYYLPVNTGPLFGWDMDTPYVQGWDDGSWTMVVAGS
jgi:Protein of unknown function (DUF2612)